MRKTVLAIIASAGLLLGASVANAGLIVIDDTSGNNGTDVSGTIMFTVEDGQGDGDYRINLSVTNTSDASWNTRMTGFGIDLISDLIEEVFAVAGWGFELDGTLPGEADSFDVCYYSGANCGGGGDDGLLTTDGTLSGFYIEFDYMSGNPTAGEVEELFAAGFEDGSLKACMRFISIPEDQGNGAGSDVACRGGDVEVPEPGTLALVGLGLLGFGLARRRRLSS